VEALFADPLHQYTRGLLTSLPRLGLLRGEAAAANRLREIPGMVPPLTKLPPGCAFAPRCPRATTAAAPTRLPMSKSARPLGGMLASRTLQRA